MSTTAVDLAYGTLLVRAHHDAREPALTARVGSVELGLAEPALAPRFTRMTPQQAIEAAAALASAAAEALRAGAPIASRPE